MLIAMLVAVAAATSEPVAPAILTHASGRAGMTVSVRDYPSDALKRGEEGRTEFRFLVNTSGTVQDCEVTLSSGSTALDTRSCEIMARGRFRPARDAQGNAVPEHWRSAITWRKNRSIILDDIVPESMPKIEVVVGTANWKSMGSLTLNKKARTAGSLLNDVGRALKAGSCAIGDARPAKFNIQVRYALQMSPNGDVHKMLVEDVGCRPLEDLVAEIVLKPPFRNGIDPPGGAEKKWYTSGMWFTR